MAATQATNGAARCEGLRSRRWWRYAVLSVDVACFAVLTSGGYILRSLTAPAVLADFGVSVSELSVVWALANAIKVVVQCAVSLVMDSVGAANTLRISFVGVALTCIATAASPGIVSYAVVMLLQNAVFILGKQPTHSALICSYFDGSELGFALGLMNIGYSLAGAALPLLCAPLLTCCGWRAAYYVIAAALLAFLPMVWNVLVLGPTSVGASEAAEMPGLTFDEVVRRPSFWLLMLSGVLFKGWEGTVTAHLPLILELEGGTSVLESATLYSILFACAIVGNLSSSAALLFVPTRVLWLISSLGFFSSHLILVVTDWSGLLRGAGLAGSFQITQSYQRQILFVVVYGICYGGMMTSLVYEPVRLYGKKALPQTLCYLFGALAIGEIIGPTAVGVIHDVYNYATSLMLITFTGSGLLFWCANALAWGPGLKNNQASTTLH